MPQLERVTYEKIFPLAPYINHKIGVSYLINEGDDPKQVLQAAKDLCEEFHRDSINTSLSHQFEQPQPPEPAILPSIQKERLSVDYEYVIDQINDCETIQDLDSWNIIAKGNHEAGMAFAKKAAELLSPKNNH